MGGVVRPTWWKGELAEKTSRTADWASGETAAELGEPRGAFVGRVRKPVAVTTGGIAMSLYCVVVLLQNTHWMLLGAQI